MLFVMIAASITISIGASLWALSERFIARAICEPLRVSRAAMTTAIFLRDSLIAMKPDAAVVIDASGCDTINFNDGRRRLNSCLMRMHPSFLRTMLDNLCNEGIPFSICTTDLDGCIYSVIGKPFGGHALISLYSKVVRNVDPPGKEVDVTTSRPYTSEVSTFSRVRNDVADQLSIAIACFGQDRSISYYNKAYTDLWGLSPKWLDKQPSEGEILDKLRELRRVPEQSDFPAWKRVFLCRDVSDTRNTEDVWHLSNGQSIRILRREMPSGGYILTCERVDERLQLERLYNTALQAQDAILNAIPDGIAIFGLDGRLKQFNCTFIKQWRLNAEDLLGEPHLDEVAKSCAVKFGRSMLWELIRSAISSPTPTEYRKWSIPESTDGVCISVLITQLPDTRLMVRFSEAQKSTILPKISHVELEMCAPLEAA